MGPGESHTPGARYLRGKLDAGTGQLDGNQALIAGHIPVKLVVVIQKTETESHTIADDHRANSVLGPGNPDGELPIMSLRGGLVP